MAPTLNVHTVDTGKRVYHVQSASNVHRPQMEFEPVDNSKSVFVPKITSKPNALVPLAEVWRNAEEIIRQSANATEMVQYVTCSVPESLLTTP